MAYIKCYSHISEKEVEYNLIGVKLKHKYRNADYGTTNDGSDITYYNTSPSGLRNEVIKDLNNAVSMNNDHPLIFTTNGGFSQGEISASGILESTYNNTNTGRNPLITGMTIHIDDLKNGINIIDAFETETVKVDIEVVKLKLKQLRTDRYPCFYELDGTTVQDIENYEVIASVYLRYIDKNSGTIMGKYNFFEGIYNAFPIKFSINSELFLIEDFDPRYKSYAYYSSRYEMRFSSGNSTDNGIRIGNNKSTDKHNFVGIAPSLLSSEWWQPSGGSYNPHPYYRTKIVDESNNELTDLKLRDLNTKADVGYMRQMINGSPNEFMKLTGGSLRSVNTERLDFANSIANSEGYKQIDYDSVSEYVFQSRNYKVAPILMPCVKPTTLTPLEEITEEGMFISLTEEIFDGTANEPDPEPEPLDPETIEPADNPETKYTPQESDGNKEFEYPGMDYIPTGPAVLNAYRGSYSNFLFKYFYHEQDTPGSNVVDPAIQFITDAANPSAFELWGATFKLLSGHPTPDEIISRVYYLPFEYDEIRYAENEPGYPKIDWTVKAAPVYGPIGPLTMGAKEYTGSNKDTGEPITSNIHYYDMMIGRFRELDLGTTTITRVFNNFMDYSDVKYTLKLPYGAGDVELDPDFLFMNGISNGTVSLKGYLDFDTGELSIIILVNDHLYHETIVSVAIDRLANVEDKMAGPLAIGKAVAAAAATAGGIAKFAGGGGGGIPIPQTPNNDLENGGKYFDEHGYARNLEIEELKRKYDKMGGI